MKHVSNVAAVLGPEAVLTSDAIAVGRILQDSSVRCVLFARFSPKVVERATGVAEAVMQNTIRHSMPCADQECPAADTTVVPPQEIWDSPTLTPVQIEAQEQLRAEPEIIPDPDAVRPYSSDEAKVVAQALQTAADMLRYRPEAEAILKECGE